MEREDEGDGDNEEKYTFKSGETTALSISYADEDVLLDKYEEAEEAGTEASGDTWPSYGERIEGFQPKPGGKRCKKHVKDLDERSFKSILRARGMLVSNPKPISSRAQKKMNQIDRQLFVSDKRLTELLKFGEELVTNIRVASDRHEYDRRKDEKQRSDQLKRDIRREGIDTTAIFNDIESRWKDLETINEPFALWEEIQEQKKRIDDITKSKDAMIERCQDEIKRLNEQFDIERMRQTNDMGCLVERIDNQVELLKAAYKHHINLLENTTEDERQVFAMNANEKWRHYLDLMNERFYGRLDEMRNHDDLYIEIIKDVAEQQEELVKETRVRLAKDCEQLELELRATKDAVLMNSEKLDYNYQVFQKRNEENTLIINQQKRCVSALYVEIADLRHEIRDRIAATSHAIKSLDSEITLLHDEIGQMRKNSHALRLVNKKKFDRIWDLNYKELLGNVNWVLDMDEMMFKQHLLLPYERPDLGITNINLAYVDGDAFKKPPPRETFFRNFKHVSKPQLRMMRNIFRRLAERGDFLVEKRLLQLLESYDDNPKQFIRLENIFNCLRVNNVDEMLALTEVFERYTYCPNCQPETTRETSAEIMLRDAKVDGRFPSLIGIPSNIYEAIKRRRSHYHRRSKVIDTDEKEEKFVCPNHFKVMEPTLVRHAMAVYSLQRDDELCPLQRRPNTCIKMDDFTINRFWEIFREAIPETKYNFWCRLEHGLFHYLKLLQLRRIYDSKCVFLRRQNAELRFLLKKFELDKQF